MLWRSLTIGPLWVNVNRDEDAAAERWMGYDEEDQPCYCRYLFRVPIDSLAEGGLYKEDLAAWRMRDGRWLIHRVITCHSDGRAAYAFYTFSESLTIGPLWVNVNRDEDAAAERWMGRPLMPSTPSARACPAEAAASSLHSQNHMAGLDDGAGRAANGEVELGYGFVRHNRIDHAATGQGDAHLGVDATLDYH